MGDASIGAMASPLLEGVIANMPLFRSVARVPLAELARQARVLHVRRGAVICRRGEAVNALYGIAYGLVKLGLRAPGGDEKVLRLAGPGETFGEEPVFREQPSALEAVALADTMLVLFPAAAVHALVERDAGFARTLLAALAERLYALVAEVESSALLSARQRVCSYLASLAQATREPRLRLPTTKTVIAARVGVTKETFSRLLHELARQGLIEVHKREILVRDAERLAALAGAAAAARAQAERAPAPAPGRASTVSTAG